MRCSGERHTLRDGNLWVVPGLVSGVTVSRMDARSSTILHVVCVGTLCVHLLLVTIRGHSSLISSRESWLLREGRVLSGLDQCCLISGSAEPGYSSRVALRAALRAALRGRVHRTEEVLGKIGRQQSGLRVLIREAHVAHLIVNELLVTLVTTSRVGTKAGLG